MRCCCVLTQGCCLHGVAVCDRRLLAVELCLVLNVVWSSELQGAAHVTVLLIMSIVISKLYSVAKADT